MSAKAIIFYILAATVLTCGAFTIFTRRIFRSAVFLLLSLIGIAGIYFLMEMDFIAAIQIIVYVGGIVVLIIFSIFLTHNSGEKLPSGTPKRLWAAIILTVGGVALTINVLSHHVFQTAIHPATDNSVRAIGRQLLDYSQHGYVFPFEVVSILLLAALIGSIVIAMKEK